MSETSHFLWLVIFAGFCPDVIWTQNSGHYVTVTDLYLVPSSQPPFKFENGGKSVLTFNYIFKKHNVSVPPSKGWVVSVSVENDKVVDIKGTREFFIDASRPSGNLSITMEGANPGRSNLQFQVKDWLSVPQDRLPKQAHSFDDQLFDLKFQVYVTMKERVIDHLFNAVIFLLVVTANIGMGTQVDLEIVKAELKRPVAPMIGLFSQFCFMPLIAYFVAINLEVEPGIGLGLFAMGCAPGGLASNIFTYLLGGNVSLSITMTLVSTLASLGMLPLWLFTLGTLLYRSSDIKIPFKNIIISLFLIIVPTVIGLVLQVRFHRVASCLIKSTKYIMAIFLLFIFTFGVYANMWVVNLVDSKVMIASAALPYLGFALGGFAAFVGRQKYREIVTIAVETGIQNTAVPIVLLRMSLKGPEQATSVVVPIISSTLTPIPLVMAIIYKEVAECIRGQKEDGPSHQEMCQNTCDARAIQEEQKIREKKLSAIPDQEPQPEEAPPVPDTPGRITSEATWKSLPDFVWRSRPITPVAQETTV